MKKKNLIIGSITNYKLEDIWSFLKSLDNFDYKGDICFIVSNNPSDVIECLKERNIKTIKAKPRSQYLHNPYLWNFLKWVGLYKSNWIFNRKYGVDLTRFLLYEEYLNDNIGKYDKVLLTDTRDVIFQSDPFEFQSDKVLAFQEDFKISQDLDYNSVWLKENYGPGVLSELEDHRIICSGTILGNQSAIQNMLISFCEELKDIRLSITGLDQGVFNYLVRKKEPALFKLMKNKEIVFTMGCVNESDFIFNDLDQLVDATGDLFPILHQYDRFPNTAKRLLNNIN